ncbi:MAG: HAD-IA family hydrolase, partial [Planctomycetales bacterium]
MTQDFAAVIFDLDGTLLHTLPDLAAATNEVLTDIGQPTHPLEAFKTLVGSGVVKLFQRALPDEHCNEHLVADCVRRFQETYMRNWNVRTKCFSGIPELLDELVQRGLKLAVLSNKPHDFTLKCIAEFLGKYAFDPVLGQRESVPRKPDPAAAFEITSYLNITPAQTLYVGDTAVDMQTARRA